VHWQALFGTQALQRADHCIGACQARAGFVCAELSFAREPHHDRTGQEAQHHFGKDGRHEVGDTATAFVLEDYFVHKVTDNPRKEHHEGVDHTLYQRKGNHVAVGYVTNFVREYCLYFIG